MENETNAARSDRYESGAGALFGRRTFIAAAGAGLGGAAVATFGVPGRVGRASAARAVPGDGTPILDGAEWPDPDWRAIPAPIRRFAYQIGRVLGETRTDTVLPLDRISPSPVVLLDRAGRDSALDAAYFVDFPVTVPGSVLVAAPPDWGLGRLQVCTDPGVLADVLAGVDNPMTAYSDLRFEDVDCWSAVPAHRDPDGLPTDDWKGAAVFWHEYFHGVQPRGPEPAPDWTDWDYSMRYPRDDARFAALGWLEQLVLADDRDPAEALATFLAIREHRRESSPELVTTLECRETREGLASHVEGVVLTRIGAIAHDADGSVRAYPPVIPDDDRWWLNWFAGRIQYAGSSVFHALTRAVGDAWKQPYCDDGALPGWRMSSVDLVRRFVPQPDPARAAELIAAASIRHDLDELERRVNRADLPSQDIGGPRRPARS